MTDYSGRPDLSVGDKCDASCVARGYEVDTGGVIKGQAVYISANGKVKPTSVSAETGIGIAGETKSAGQMCRVWVRGPVKATAGGAIAGGGSVKGSTSGKVIANPYNADINMVDKNMGYRSETIDTVADGDLIIIVLNR